MKKFKFISILICAVTIISALAIASSAKWWDENPFTDVKSSHWYYDAVRITNENGIFNGTSETKFTPSGKMTRAMLVQALASADGFNKEEYKGINTFTDVKDSHWFAPAVEWAYANKITSGKTETTFAPNENITREQLAAMLYRYAEYKGMKMENSKDISEFPDSSKVGSWAVKNFEWAYGNGIINGSKKGDALYLNPRNPATRAECATMFSKYLYLTPVYEINGNDLSLYTIVRSENAFESVADAATALSKYIEMSTGYTLPVVTDGAEVGEYEILVGRTNREDAGIVTVDRASFADDQDFLCSVQGNYLVIAGIDSDPDYDDGSRTTFRIDGTQNAVYYFLEEEFGLNFYYKNEGIFAEPDPVISLENGYEYIDGPSFETRTLYIADKGDDSYLDCGYYYCEWGCGFPHQLGNLMMKGDLSSDNTWDTPCLSEPENIERLITNVKALLERKPNLNLVGLIQNDSQAYCRCTLCGAAYREEGTRGGALLRLMNTVAETFEDEYPTVKFATWAYNWSIDPPKSDFKFHKNIILHYNTLHLCPAHEYSDSKNCKFNYESAEHIAKWGEITERLYLWEHTGAFTDALTPFPDFDSMLANAKYFDDNGCEGVFLNSMSSRVADFCELRGYLFSRVYRDPQMSEEEYSYRMNGFLKAYYGDGWQSIRKYIDEVTELANEKCHSFHAATSGYYDYAHVREVADRFDSYWDEAEAKAKDPKQLENIQITRLSWIYLRQCATYETEYENGTEQQRKAYEEANGYLAKTCEKYRVEIAENFDKNYDLNVSISPEKWG